MLDVSGVQTDMDTLVRQVYLPGQKGSLQPELLAAIRAADRVPYQIDGTLAALADEVRGGRPVLVLQNLGIAWLPRWHYAVVIGVDAVNERVVLRSGVDARRVTKLRTFLHTWRRGGYWGIVTLPVEDFPVNVDRSRWFNSLSALEQTGRHEAALRGWSNAVQRWPDSAVALFGMANSHYALQHWAAAEQGYRQLLGLQPALAIAHNNLALTLMQQGRYAEAEREATGALHALQSDAALRPELLQTLSDIRERQLANQ